MGKRKGVVMRAGFLCCSYLSCYHGRPKPELKLHPPKNINTTSSFYHSYYINNTMYRNQADRFFFTKLKHKTCGIQMWEYSFLWVSNMLNIDFGLGNPSTFQINMLNNVNKFYISEILTKTLYNILDLIISRKKNKS